MTMTRSDTIEHVIGPTGRFSLRALSGSIELRAVDGGTVRVHERSGKSITDLFEVEAGEGSLSLATPDRGGLDFVVFGIGRRGSIDLEIDVPRAAEVVVEAASADIEAGGFIGRTRFRTASGDLELTAMRGSLEVDAVSGDVVVTADGEVGLKARTISGDLAFRGPTLGRAVVETTSGDIRLDAALAGPGPYELQTVSGDATIVGRTGMRVEARTVTGDLRSDLAHRVDRSPGRKELIVGDGAATLTFKSVSGDLRVVAPRDAGPATIGPSPMPEPPGGPAAPDETRAAASERREAGHEVARLDVLRALERGELSIEAAMDRLAAIEEA